MNSAGDKVNYWHPSPGNTGLYRSTAYLDRVEGDRAWGTEKHSDDPVELVVVDDRWVQVARADELPDRCCGCVGQMCCVHLDAPCDKEKNHG